MQRIKKSDVYTNKGWTPLKKKRKKYSYIVNGIKYSTLKMAREVSKALKATESNPKYKAQFNIKKVSKKAKHRRSR